MSEMHGRREMGDEGELNVGQLVREAHGNSALLVGFTTHEGTVTAASDWDGPAERKRVQPSLDGSFESLFHSADQRHFGLDLTKRTLVDSLRSRSLERAIGVVYRPATERASHYFAASLSDQFDAVIHLDSTRAVEPLESTAEPSRARAPRDFSLRGLIGTPALFRGRPPRRDRQSCRGGDDRNRRKFVIIEGESILEGLVFLVGSLVGPDAILESSCHPREC